ncbi:hypothetical protein Q3G72_010571 [Acer saccharum]|nr:hypothetical protein Q3G72_010571 [Acer saccharum]
MAVSSKLHLLVMITLIFIPVPSSQFQNHDHTRDVKRVAAITQLLSPTRSYEVENLGTDSVSGHSIGFTEYLVRVGIAGVTIRMTRFSTLPLQLQLPTLLFRVGPPPVMPSSSMIAVAMQASVVTRPWRQKNVIRQSDS